MRRLISLSLVLAGAACLGGCAAGALVGGMMESNRRHSKVDVEAEYAGLTGKSFAVIVAADRAIQAQHPGIEANMIARISEDLKRETGASGYIPPAPLLDYLLNNPNWSAKPLGQLAEELEVDRLVFIDLYEFHLNEPGNQYVWSGAAEGTVGVIEADGVLPDEFAFQKGVRVQYPDSSGFTRNDLTSSQVASVLVSRFVRRAAWTFYDHEEDYYPKF